MAIYNEFNIFKHKPFVSIVINNYNYGQFIGAAIDSALNQTYLHAQVIVVDDGSTDNSREIIKSYEGRIISVLKENGGQASAFNVGFAASCGDIICLLDSDDIFVPEKIAEVVDVFAEHQDVDWCFHPVTLVNININAFIKNSPKILSRECDFRADIKRGKMPFNPPATSGLCFKRSLLKMILPMPEAENVSISDNYLKFSAIALSKGFLLGKELAVQRIHGSNAYTLRNDKQKQQLRAKIFILTAYWLRIKFPVLAKSTNKLFARGVALCWQNKNIEKEYKEVITIYFFPLSLLEKIKINFRAFYYYFMGQYLKKEM